MDKFLHIISFDQPNPPNYGGVIDVYFKIKALHAQGIKIILHIFEYGRGRDSGDLSMMCEKIFYYRRQIGVQSFSLLRPYIVNSRRNMDLLEHLLLDKHPILFEGLHTTFFINHPKLATRNKFIRLHNIEHKYYDSLAKNEKSFFKRIYYKLEAKLLERYEVIIKCADAVFPISSNDQAYFANQKEGASVMLRPFHENEGIISKVGSGTYCLYHGNLSIAENVEAVSFLIENVFNVSDKKLIVAGAKPSPGLINLCEVHENVELVANPEETKLLDLMLNAHIQLLHATQETGMKLKWINSLFQGRFLVGNKLMFNEIELASLCIEANLGEEYLNKIDQLFEEEFTIEEIEKRKIVLNTQLANATNAQQLIGAIWPS